MLKQYSLREAALTETLVHNAGKDPREDAFYSGYILAVKDFVNISLDDIKET